jgi:hypothetical protein
MNHVLSTEQIRLRKAVGDTPEHVWVVLYLDQVHHYLCVPVKSCSAMIPDEVYGLACFEHERVALESGEFTSDREVLKVSWDTARELARNVSEKPTMALALINEHSKLGTVHWLA